MDPRLRGDDGHFSSFVTLVKTRAHPTHASFFSDSGLLPSPPDAKRLACREAPLAVDSAAFLSRAAVTFLLPAASQPNPHRRQGPI
jgi:hypothetical protein